MFKRCLLSLLVTILVASSFFPQIALANATTIDVNQLPSAIPPADVSTELGSLMGIQTAQLDPDELFHIATAVKQELSDKMITELASAAPDERVVVFYNKAEALATDAQISGIGGFFKYLWLRVTGKLVTIPFNLSLAQEIAIEVMTAVGGEIIGELIGADAGYAKIQRPYGTMEVVFDRKLRRAYVDIKLNEFISKPGDYYSVHLDKYYRWSNPGIYLFIPFQIDAKWPYQWSTQKADVRIRYTGGWQVQAEPRVEPEPITKPSPPSNLEATVTGPSQVKLIWDDNSNNELGFLIERRNITWLTWLFGGFQELVRVGANVETFTDTTVTAGQTFEYRVMALNPAGHSPASNLVRVTIPAAVVTPTPTPQITGISPSPVPGSDTHQWLTITGTNFVFDSTVTLHVGGATFPIPRDRTTFVNSTQIRIFVNVTTAPATWAVQVINPGNLTSGLFNFNVVALTPDIPPPGIPSDKWIPRTQWGTGLHTQWRNTILKVEAESPPIPWAGQIDHTRILSERGGITHVIIHHTDLGHVVPTTDFPSWTAVVRSIWHDHANVEDKARNKERWYDIGYHFLIDPDGNVFQGRSSVRIIGTHAGIGNIGTVGIAFLGDFNDNRKPTAAAIESAVKLIAGLFRDAGINNPEEKAEHARAGRLPRIGGHRDYRGKIERDCPGDNLYARLGDIRSRVAAQLRGETINQPPVISSMTATLTLMTVRPGETSIISVRASDPENDHLTFSWSASGGMLSATSGPGDKTWTAPNTPDTYTITISITDNQPGHLPVSRSVDITVKAEPTPLSITTLSLPTGTVGTSYNKTLLATSGREPYSWYLVSGSLPLGLSLNATTGVISGTPTSAGIFSFTVRVRDSSSPVQTASRAFSIAVNLAGTLVERAVRNARDIVGAPYLGDGLTWGGKGRHWDRLHGHSAGEARWATPEEVRLTGYRWRQEGPIQPGIDCSGLIMWAYNRAHNPMGRYLDPGNPVYREGTGGQWDDTKRMARRFNFTGSTAVTSFLNEYNANPGKFGLLPGDPSYFLNPRPGVIGHVVMYIGNGRIIHATHPEGVIEESLTTVLRRYTGGGDWFHLVGLGRVKATVVAPELHVSPTTITGSLVSGTGWTDIGRISVTNRGVGTLSWSSTDDRVWLEVTPTSGTTTTETDTVTVRATTTGLSVGPHTGTISFTGAGMTRTVSVSLTINPAPLPLTITTTSLPSGTVGISYSASLLASGGRTPYSWSIIGDSLPPGLSLSPGGVISGTPTSSGSFGFTVRVGDSSSPAQTAQRTLSITILTARPSLSFTSLTPSQITTSTALFDATLSAGGSNFNNVVQIIFSWSGVVSGSATWNRGDSAWNARVTVHSDSSMTLRPRVVETSPTWSGTVHWTVTLRDNTGASASRSFTVTYTRP
jgi:cell wall-associated NlpC family hydrolase